MTRIDDRRDHYREVKRRRISGMIHEESRARVWGVALVVIIIAAWVVGGISVVAAALSLIFQ